MKFTGLIPLIPDINNPTLRNCYIVNLIHVVLFFVISLIVRGIINKKILQVNKKSEGNSNISSKMMLMIILVSGMMLCKKVYAIMGWTTYNFNIITLVISFIGIYFANIIIELIINSKSINRIKLYELLSETIIENIFFTTVFIVCMMIFTTVISNILIFTVVITSIYKVIKICRYKKWWSAIVYFLILGITATFASVSSMAIPDGGKGIYLERTVEEWRNGDYRIEGDLIIKRIN